MISSEREYGDFCQAHTAELPIFFQPWWLDAVGQHGHWQKYVIRGSNDNTIGIWPIFTKRRYGFQWRTLPPYSPVSGPWFAENDALSQPLLAALTSQLAGGQLYWLVHSMRYVQQALWWQKNGFEVHIWHTYRLPVTNDPDNLFRRFRTTTRNEIRKAARNLLVRPVGHLQHFLPLYIRHARAKGIFTPAVAQVFECIYNASLERGQGQLLCAYDKEGNLHAGVFLVWDHQNTYVQSISRNQDFQTSSATRLILWQAIKQSATSGRAFDFNGGDVPSIGDFFASFGAEKVAYLRAVLYPNALVRFVVRLAKYVRHPQSRLFH